MTTAPSAETARVLPVQSPLHLYRRVQDYLKEGRHLALATVISRSGSGPREAGASMVIADNGGTMGTVGGGLLEAKVLELAKEALLHEHSACLTMTLTSQQAAISGMICGGRMEVLIEYLNGSDPLYTIGLGRLLSPVTSQGPCLLIRSIEVEGDGVWEENRTEASSWVKTGWGLLTQEGLDEGSLTRTEGDALNALKDNPPAEPVLINGDPVRYFIQPIGGGQVVLIVGAGHVGQALAAFCPAVGFGTFIIDDRAEFASRVRFPEADDIRVQASLENCFDGLAITKDSFIVIVTRGHAFDRDVLAQSLRTTAGYIGMIASKTKRDLIYKSLLADGFTQEAIARVHSPIGISIGAKTPAEIAVSILAELIAVRSGTC
ncbi:MAG: XdhC family protein [Syntrophales bacterium]|nr:XdhC family protein [Syntrophales bacterium]